jgi:hypothetical protein
MMRKVFEVLMVIGIIGGTCLALLKLTSPSGVLVRRVVRDNPLANPLTVTAIDGLTLIAGGQRYLIGGVRAPAAPADLVRLSQFVQVVTAQGIEIESSTAFPNGYSIRCEPRIWHWCGNDPVAAHFEQQNLNELLVALGFAVITPDIRKLTTPQALHLRAAERYAQRFGPKPNSSNEVSSLNHGINISAIVNVRPFVEMAAYQIMREQSGDR